MRKSARAFGLVVLALVTSVVLGVASAFMAAFALGAATALIVPGTGTPNANIVTDYRENAADRYIAPFEPCTSTNGCTLVGINYPASFWPLGFIGNWCPGFQCDTWNESVGTGVANLDTALRAALDNTSDDIVIFGYSQGGAVVSNELRNLGDLTPEERARLSVVTIGNAYNPDGGIFTRLGFLPTIPIFDITFGPAMPTNTGIPITSIGFQYDPVMYAPLYWGNPFAVLNAFAAFQTVHGFYLTPNGNGPTDPIAYGYTEEEIADILAGSCPGPNCRVDSNGNEYWMIPAKSLPIVDLVTGMLPSPLQPVVKPVADLISPVLKVLIDLGYDWSGDPGVERWLSPLPFNPLQNWPAVAVNLVAAAVEGIQAFVDDLGGLTTTIAPPVPAPTSDTQLSTLATATATETSETAETTETVSEAKTSTPTLTVVNDITANLSGLFGANPTQSNATKVEQVDPTQPAVTKDSVVIQRDREETQQDLDGTRNDTAGVRKNRDSAKKNESGVSVSLNFSPKKRVDGDTGPAAAGQDDAAATTSSKESEPAKAAA